MQSSQIRIRPGGGPCSRCTGRISPWPGGLLRRPHR